jgi:hypothetical protein
MGPLAGIRVVDLSSMLSGPWATMILADQGADVIKVEEPKAGDHTRSLSNRHRGFSAQFLNLNRNKRSITLDLKTGEGRAILKRLAATADVLVQNFRPGVVERLGIDEAAIRAVAPQIVYVSISGFGESIRVLGKGWRERTLPLWKTTATALRAWLAVRGQPAVPEMFVNARGEPLSRWGFAYLLKQHVATAARQRPGLAKKRVSPHVLRHTCAMIILQATQDIRKVSLWLGHATLTTTEVYTRGDPTEKLDAMEAIVPPHLRRGAFQPSDKLIALLKPAS